MSKKVSSKILINDENNLGYSYYIDDYYYSDYSYSDYSYSDYYYDDYRDDYYDDDYYYDDYKDDDDYYYYDSDYYYSDNYYTGNYYYPRYYDTTYVYDEWRCEEYYYDDYRDNRDNELTVYGDTLKVGSHYDNNIWLNDVTSGSYATVRVIDGKDNDKNLLITGNSRSNSIYSGDGVTTLWGAGGGSNTLVGGSKRNYFWYQGNSKDVATKFSTGDSSNSDVVVLSNVNCSSINRDSSSITFNMADGNYMQVQFENSSNYDDPILISSNGSDIYRYKIAQNTSTSLNYRDDVNKVYFAQPGQLMVSGGGHNIWLGGEAGQQFTNVSTINAGASEGYNTLAGNNQANVIIGGNGNSSLWGYHGTSDDTLIGGQGAEVFYAGRFEGNDVIYTEQSHDVIFLYDTNLSDITSVSVIDGLISANFNSGNTLRIHNNTEVTSVFQLANGERYNYNRSTQQWQGA